MADPAAAALAMAHQQRLQVHLSAAQNAAGSGSPADLIQYFTATNPNAASVLKNLVPAQQADLARRLQELSRTQPLANAAMVGLQPTTMAAPQQAANAVGRPVAVVQGKPGSFPGTAPGVSNQIPVMTAAALHSQLRPGMGIAGIPGLQGVGLPQLALGPNGQIMTLTNQGVILGQRPTLASTAMQQQALNLAGITKQQAVAAAVVQQQANQEALARQQSQQLYLAQQRQQAQAVQQQFQARSGAANAASPPPDASRAMMSGGKQHQNAAGTFSLPIVKPSSPHDIGSPNTPKASQGMNGHGVVSLQAALQQINAAHAAADAVAVMRANNRSEELSKRLKSESGAYPSPSASMTGNGGASDDARIKVEQAMSNEVEQAGKTKVQRVSLLICAC